MRKVLMSGFRINPELLRRLQIFLRERGMTLTEALEKSLSFLLSSPHEVLEFKGKLFLSPESSLNRIRNNSILAREEMVFIVTFIQKAYEEAPPSKLVNASWVRHLAAVFRLMLPCLSRGGRRALNPEFLRLLSAYGHGAEAKMENIASHLSHCDRVPVGYANNLSKCLLIFLLDSRYELSDEVLKEIKLHLEPWCFGVAKRGLSDPPANEMPSQELLGKEVSRKEGDHFFLKKRKVMLDVFLSKGPASPLGWRREFRCEYFSPAKAAMSFYFDTFYDLLQCLIIIREGKEEAPTRGRITVHASPESPRIRLGAAMAILTQEEFDEFVDLTWELYNREDAQADLMKEYVENYGVL